MINQLFLDHVHTVLAAPFRFGTGMGVIFGTAIGAYESLVYRSPNVILRVLWNTVVWANIYAIASGIGVATIAYLLLYGFSLNPITSNYLDFGDNGIEILFPFLLLPSVFASLVGAIIGSAKGSKKGSN